MYKFTTQGSSCITLVPSSLFRVGKILIYVALCHYWLSQITLKMSFSYSCDTRYDLPKSTKISSFAREKVRMLNYENKSVELQVGDNRPLQKRERTGKEYGCFPFVWKTKIFKWKINYILESLPRREVFGRGKWQNGSSTNITQNREFVWIG